MKKNIKSVLFFLLLLNASTSVRAQKLTISQKYDKIINDRNTSPEIRVLACVRKGCEYVDKQGIIGKNQKDSAFIALSQGRQLSKILGINLADGELLYLAGRDCKFRRAITDAKAYNELAIKLLRKKSHSEFLGRALLEKGDYLNIDLDDQLYEKIALFKEALESFNNPENALTKASVWKRLGDLYQERLGKDQNSALAMDAYQHAETIYIANGITAIQDIYISMANLYLELGDNQKGLKYCLIAGQTAEAAKDTSRTLCQIFNYTGNQYVVLLDPRNAAKYYKLSLRIALKQKNDDDAFVVAYNLLQVYRKLKNYQSVKLLINEVHNSFPESNLDNKFYTPLFYLLYYMGTKNLSKGRPYCLQLTQLLSGTANHQVNSLGRVGYLTISNFYLMDDDIANAYRFWNKAYDVTKRFSNNPMTKNTLYFLHYQIDSANHNLSSALKYLRQYSTVRDSIFTTGKAQQESNMKILYDVQSKELKLNENKQKIKMLTKNEELGRANLRQAILIRNVIIGFTIILLIVGVILYQTLIFNKKAAVKIAKSNILLEKLVSEKEWLLREIHHRVKNNLHTVICLLESQSSFLENDALKAIEDSRHRIYAMSLIHQKLYENENLKTINIKEYVSSLVNYLQDGFGLNGRIVFELKIEAILIDTSIAIPISLIINEAITNSIKYAFPESQSGQITIELMGRGENIEVIMKDNGKGIDMKYVNTPVLSMGIRLIKGLADDIGGKICISNDNGTIIILECSHTLKVDEVTNIQELLNNIPDAIES